jgi:MOSC domain-containing protein YiiM
MITPVHTAQDFYAANASVVQEGTFAAGDQIVLRRRASEWLTVVNVWLYSAQQKSDTAVMERIECLKLLPDFWNHRIEC